jgi:hypothetical protein
MTIQESAGPAVPSPPAFPETGPRGIGGWLILPIIGFIGTIALTAVNLAQVVISWDGLVAIFSATGALAEAKFPVAGSFVAGLLVIASAAYCLYLIFTKKRAIVKFATAHYLILAAAGLFEWWGTGVLERAIPSLAHDPTAVRDGIRGVVIACVWIPYFNVSRRVRNTFVNPPADVAA